MDSPPKQGQLFNKSPAPLCPQAIPHAALPLATCSRHKKKPIPCLAGGRFILSGEEFLEHNDSESKIVWKRSEGATLD